MTKKEIRKIIKEELNKILKETSVQDEFKMPCQTQFETAVEAMKFLIQYHDENSLFDELRKVVDDEVELKNV